MNVTTSPHTGLCKVKHLSAQQQAERVQRRVPTQASIWQMVFETKTIYTEISYIQTTKCKLGNRKSCQYPEILLQGMADCSSKSKCHFQN